MTSVVAPYRRIPVIDYLTQVKCINHKWHVVSTGICEIQRCIRCDKVEVLRNGSRRD